MQLLSASCPLAQATVYHRKPLDLAITSHTRLRKIQLPKSQNRQQHVVCQPAGGSNAHTQVHVESANGQQPSRPRATRHTATEVRHPAALLLCQAHRPARPGQLGLLQVQPQWVLGELQPRSLLLLLPPLVVLNPAGQVLLLQQTDQLTALLQVHPQPWALPCLGLPHPVQHPPPSQPQQHHQHQQWLPSMLQWGELAQTCACGSQQPLLAAHQLQITDSCQQLAT